MSVWYVRQCVGCGVGEVGLVVVVEVEVGVTRTDEKNGNQTVAAVAETLDQQEYKPLAAAASRSCSFGLCYPQ